MPERSDVQTFKGDPLTLTGNEVKQGDKAPDFTLVANDLSEVKLADSAGKVRIISVVPSLDTPVCDTQTRRFNEEASSLGDDVRVLTVSVDLPFAQSRWCGAAGVERVQTASDYRDGAFGESYGVMIKGLCLLARAIFVVDKSDVVQHVEYVGELTSEPNYDAALSAAKSAV